MADLSDKSAIFVLAAHSLKFPLKYKELVNKKSNPPKKPVKSVGFLHTALSLDDKKLS
jgi:hypothetical protein